MTELHLRFSQFTVALESGDNRLLSRVASYYRPFVLPAQGDTLANARLLAITGGTPSDEGLRFSPWDARGKESFAELAGRRVIRKDRTGVQICVNGRRWSIAGDLQRNFSQLQNVIGAQYGIWLLDKGAAMLHGSAVIRDGKAMAFIGQSGSGKSSAAVRLLERGSDFLSNDRLILEARSEEIVAHGLPKLPRVNPGTLLASGKTRWLVDGASRRRYEQMTQTELWSLEEKRDLDVQTALGRRWILSAPLDCAFVLAWRQGASGFDLELLHADQALEALLDASKTFGPFDRRLGVRDARALQQVTRRLPVYRVTGAVDPTRLATSVATGRWRQLIA